MTTANSRAWAGGYESSKPKRDNSCISLPIRTDVTVCAEGYTERDGGRLVFAGGGFISRGFFRQVLRTMRGNAGSENGECSACTWIDERTCRIYAGLNGRASVLASVNDDKEVSMTVTVALMGRAGMVEKKLSADTVREVEEKFEIIEDLVRKFYPRAKSNRHTVTGNIPLAGTLHPGTLLVTPL